MIGCLAVAYVAVVSAALSVRGRRMGRTLATSWAVAVLLLGVVFSGTGLWASGHGEPSPSW